MSLMFIARCIRYSIIDVNKVKVKQTMHDARITDKYKMAIIDKLTKCHR